MADRDHKPRRIAEIWAVRAVRVDPVGLVYLWPPEGVEASSMADRERQRLIFAHQEWLGFVQPVGLVVSPPVMVDAQVVPDRNVSGRQREFIALLERDDTGATARWRAPDLRRVFLDWLGWDEADLADADTDRERLEIALPELHAVLAPTWAVPADGGNEGGEAADSDGKAADISNGEAAGHGHKEAASHGAGEAAGNSDRETAGSDDGKAARWQMLIRVEPDGADLDAPPADAAWNASRHERFVRLLSETGVPAGLLCTDDRIRLIHAPGGETPGYLTFDFSQMAMPAGRPILAAFDMLLSAGAMFMNAEEVRLPALLARSREAQAEVSTRLARQVLAALYELLRGFVAADAHRGALPALARESPDHLYSGLIVVLMRLVFLLYTEDRGMMPGHPVYQQHYSLGGLFARLRADAAAWPDTMDQRFGAWAQLLSLFRLVYGGGRHGNLSFVARKGRLFDPARFPFLERLPLSKRSGSAEAAEAGTADEGEVPPGQSPARSPGFPDPEAGSAGEAALPPDQPSARPPEFPGPEAGSADETTVPPASPSPDNSGRQRAEDEADLPLVPDRTVWRVLENGARRGAALLPDAGRRADRLGLRSDHGVPDRTDGGAFHRGALPETDRRRGGRGRRRVAVGGRRQARQGGRGADRPQAGGRRGRRVAAGRRRSKPLSRRWKAGSIGTRPTTSCPRTPRPATDGRAPPLRQPLHPEHVHRPHRRGCAQSALRPLGTFTHARFGSSTSRSSTLRWARAPSWSKPAASSPGSWSKPGTRMAGHRPSLPTKTSCCTPGA